MSEAKPSLTPAERESALLAEFADAWPQRHGGSKKFYPPFASIGWGEVIRDIVSDLRVLRATPRKSARRYNNKM